MTHLTKRLLALSLFISSAHAGLLGPKCSEDVCAKDPKAFQACVKKGKCLEAQNAAQTLQNLMQQHAQLQQQYKALEQEGLRNPYLIHFQSEYKKLKAEFDMIDEATEDTTREANPDLYRQYDNIKDSLQNTEKNLDALKTQVYSKPEMAKIKNDLRLIESHINEIKGKYPVLR